MKETARPTDNTAVKIITIFVLIALIAIPALYRAREWKREHDDLRRTLPDGTRQWFDTYTETWTNFGTLPAPALLQLRRQQIEAGMRLEDALHKQLLAIQSSQGQAEQARMEQIMRQIEIIETQHRIRAQDNVTEPIEYPVK